MFNLIIAIVVILVPLIISIVVGNYLYKKKGTPYNLIEEIPDTIVMLVPSFFLTFLILICYLLLLT